MTMKKLFHGVVNLRLGRTVFCVIERVCDDSSLLYRKYAITYVFRNGIKLKLTIKTFLLYRRRAEGFCVTIYHQYGGRSEMSINFQR